MKNLFSITLLALLILAVASCKKDDKSDENTTLAGTPSPMGEIGTTVQSSSAPIAGMSELTATVVSQENGISSYSGSGLVTNQAIRNILANLPGITISGDTVRASGYRFKQTVEGIESYVGMGPGIIVKYASTVGDTYPVGSTGRVRTVVSKSTSDDYSYGMLLIKVMQIDEPTPGLKSLGVNKMTYWANHRFGLVGIRYDFTDGTNLKLPVYCSAENGK